MKVRHKIIPAAYLIPYKSGKILLSRRFNTGFEDGKYGLISGHVEEQESFTDCLFRESKEEANITVKEKDVKVIHVMHRNCGKHDERADVFYICKKWKGNIKNMEPDKCDDLKWFPIKKLPKNTIDYVKSALTLGLIKKTFYSEWNF